LPHVAQSVQAIAISSATGIWSIVNRGRFLTAWVCP
jgi:hypothetical protein